MPAYVTGTTSMAASGGMAIQYAPHGAPTSFYYGNKVVRSMSYNNRLQMAGFDDSITMQGTSPVKYDLLNASLNWYIGSATATNNGNLWGSTYTISGPGYSAPLPFTQVYMYDGENRLSNVTDQTNGTSNFTRGFLYDAFGNMWVDTTTAATTSGITPSGNTPTANVYAATGRNQINGGSYDAAGNEILVNGNNVTYDGEGRQTAVAGSGVNETYIYDADGKRVGKIGSGTNPPTTVFVYDALGRMAAQYATVPDATNCITCYLSADQLGTARLVTDQGGNVVARHDYLPFGEEITAPQLAGRDSHWGVSGDLIQQKFTGKERDSESGLDYFGARYYGSALGRFTGPDAPFADQHTEDPQSWNMYAYVRNNPLKNTDPDGRDCTDGVSACLNYIAGGLKALGNVPTDVFNAPTTVVNAALSLTPTSYRFTNLFDPLFTANGPDQRQGMEAANAVMLVTPVAEAGAAKAAEVLGSAAKAETAASAITADVPTSIPAGPSARPTAAQQRAINEMGDAHGCSTCGATTPGTTSGNWVGDHQPLTALNPPGGAQVYQPQCLQCSRQQGGQVAAAAKAAKKAACTPNSNGTCQ